MKNKNEQGKYIENEPIQSFMEKVSFAANGCWLWRNALPREGKKARYGAFSSKKMGYRNGISAHRASWVLHKGEIPDGLFVLHECDNPACVNPDHLFLGTQKDNCADREAKGRRSPHLPPVRYGVPGPNPKLDAVKAFEIRWYSAMGRKQRELAKEYGVSQSVISNVVHNKIWVQEIHD